MIKLSRSPEYQLKRTSNKLVLWHENQTLRVSCNDSAALVWNFASERISATEIANRIQNLVTGDASDIRNEVFNIVNDLVQKGVLIEDVDSDNMQTGDVIETVSEPDRLTTSPDGVDQQVHRRIEHLESRVAALSEELKDTQQKTKSQVQSTHNSLRLFCDLLMYQARNPGVISNEKGSSNRNLSIVTGASSSHLKPLLRLLFSLGVHEPLTTIFVYDLGLQKEELQTIRKLFPSVHIRRFDYDLYPVYFNIKVNRGEYAWKPVIIYEVAKNATDYVIWLDAGDLVVNPLHDIRALLDEHSFYSPGSSGTIRDWTHPGMIEALKLSSEFLDKPNRSGGLVSLDPRNYSAMELLERWRRCALDQNCIAPPGSSRSNHRQDQAALSILMYQSTFADSPLQACLSVKFHQNS
ncbi:DUF1647 domain-containing protein [Pseudomonadota bacterium]